MQKEKASYTKYSLASVISTCLYRETFHAEDETGKNPIMDTGFVLHSNNYCNIIYFTYKSGKTKTKIVVDIAIARFNILSMLHRYIFSNNKTLCEL